MSRIKKSDGGNFMTRTSSGSTAIIDKEKDRELESYSYNGENIPDELKNKITKIVVTTNIINQNAFLDCVALQNIDLPHA